MGATVGGLLSGGQITFSSIINAKTNSEFKQIGKFAKQTSNITDIINYAKNSIDTDIRALALETNSESINDLTAGKLYNYVVSDISTAINTANSLELVKMISFRKTIQKQ